MVPRNYGRYRKVSDEAVVMPRQNACNRLTLRQLARELGVCKTTVVNVIQSRGQHYKTESPEVRRQRSLDRPGRRGRRPKRTAPDE
jgi:hypothetical protein